MPNAHGTVPGWTEDHTLPAGMAAIQAATALTTVDPAHYVDRRELAAGGMGCIVTAYDTRLRRRVAIKELRGADTGLEQRFARETLLTARLEHPGIVSIHEGGRWPNGMPFYAMKLYSGRPLDQLISQAPTLAARLGLLPHVLAIADAMAYAHQQRIIHRDLKPGNVMIGSFGETVVIDWGLAKDLSGVTPDVDTHRGLAQGSGDLTLASDVMGTPAYMPLEQALSPLVDERADVYAIGAILYHVLAGALPYPGRSAMEVLAQLQDAPPPPLTSRVDGVPRDLVAIVERAMARDAADRYPTARELADDLRRFQTGQLVGAHAYSTRQLLTRWVRKHRLPLLVASAATLALVALGAVSFQRVVAEERRATAARKQAETNQASTEEVMQFMLGNLGDKLAEIGRLELLATVATQAQSHYADLPSDGTPRDLLRRAKAQVAIAEVRRAQGKPTEAMAACRASLAYAERVDGIAPIRKARNLHLAHAQDCIGDNAYDLADFDGAIAAYDASLELARALPATKHARGLAITQALSLGSVLPERDPVRAQAVLVQAVADATDAGDRLRTAEAHRQLANLLRSRDLPAAVDHQRQAVAGFAALATGDDLKPRVRLADNTAWLAELLAKTLPDEADALSVDAIALMQAVVAKDPLNVGYQESLQRLRMIQIDVLVHRRQWNDVIAAVQAARPLSEKLAASADNPNNKFGLALLDHQAADALAASQRLPEAAAAYRLAAAAYDALGATIDADAIWQNSGITHLALGQGLATMGRDADALPELNRARELAIRGMTRDATALMWPKLLFQASLALADLHQRQGDRAARATATAQTREAATAMLALDPAWRPAAVAGATTDATPAALLARLERRLAGGSR